MFLLICLSLVALPVATASVQEPSFGTLDRDRDGQLSPREVAALSLNFEALDTNDNGYLSRSEMNQERIEPKVKNAKWQASSDRDAKRGATLKPPGGKPCKPAC